MGVPLSQQQKMKQIDFGNRKSIYLGLYGFDFMHLVCSNQFMTRLYGSMPMNLVVFRSNQKSGAKERRCLNVGGFIDFLRLQ